MPISFPESELPLSPLPVPLDNRGLSKDVFEGRTSTGNGLFTLMVLPKFSVKSSL